MASRQVVEDFDRPEQRRLGLGGGAELVVEPAERVVCRRPFLLVFRDVRVGGRQALGQVPRLGEGGQGFGLLADVGIRRPELAEAAGQVVRMGRHVRLALAQALQDAPGLAEVVDGALLALDLGRQLSEEEGSRGPAAPGSRGRRAAC